MAVRSLPDHVLAALRLGEVPTVRARGSRWEVLVAGHVCGTVRRTLDDTWRVLSRYLAISATDRWWLPTAPVAVVVRHLLRTVYPDGLAWPYLHREARAVQRAVEVVSGADWPDQR